MIRRAAIYFLVTVSILLTLSCAKLPEEPTPQKGDIAKEPIPHVDSIPIQWGNLISVSSLPAYPDWALLWFQDDKGDVRMAGYDARSNKFGKEFMLLRRK